MSLKDPRADSLPLIRDFMVTISQGIVKRLSDFNLIRPSWSRTRCYHYWSAMRDLGLAKLEKAKIVLLPLGTRLVRVAQFNRFQAFGTLNDAEMEVFREAFLKYERIKRFLTYFISTGESFKNYEQLKKYGALVKIKRHPEDSRGIVLIDASNSERSFSSTEARTLRWSLKFWCQDAGIIDEIWLEKESWYSQYLVEKNVPDRVLFPIKKSIKGINLGKFQKMLDLVIQQHRTYSILLPILAYYFCKTYFVTVEDFHSKLIELYHSDPYHYYLVKGSLADVKENVRARGHENYPRVDRYLRNFVIIRKEGTNYGT